MRLRSLVTSTVFHIVIIVLATVGFVLTPEREISLPPPITVEFAKLDLESKTPTPVIKPPDVKNKPPKAEPPKKKDRPEQAPTNTSKTPVAPPREKPKEEPPPPKQEAEVAPKPKPIPKKDVPPKPPEPEVNKKQAKKQEEAKEKPKKDAAPQRDFGSVLKNLAEVEPAPKEAEIADVIEKVAGQQAPAGEQMTVSELSALRRQLESCWSVPIGARNIENMVIEVNIIVGRDRIVKQAGIVDKARYNSDSFFRAVADTAIRAVYSPSCSPLDLPEDKYELWKNIIVDFNPKDMF